MIKKKDTLTSGLSPKEKAERALELHKLATRILNALVNIEEAITVTWQNITALKKLGREDNPELIAANRAYSSLVAGRREAVKNYQTYCATALELSR